MYNKLCEIVEGGLVRLPVLLLRAVRDALRYGLGNALRRLGEGVAGVEDPEGLAGGGEEAAGGGEGAGIVFVYAEAWVGFAVGEGLVAVADGLLEARQVGSFEGRCPEGAVGGGQFEARPRFCLFELARGLFKALRNLSKTKGRFFRASCNC